MAVIRRGVWRIVFALVAGMLIGGAAVSLFAAPEEMVAMVESQAVLVSTVDIPAGADGVSSCALGKNAVASMTRKMYLPTLGYEPVGCRHLPRHRGDSMSGCFAPI